jgi:hypothetical protein
MRRQTKLTRRSAIRTLGLAGMGIVAGTGFGLTTGKATALALCGDESHNSDYIRAALNSTLVEGAGLSINFTDEEKLLTYENLRSYKIGSVASFKVNPNGSLSGAVSLMQHTGSSVDQKRQTVPYAHAVVLSPDNRSSLSQTSGWTRSGFIISMRQSRP